MTFRPLAIGNVAIEPPLILAPMSGVTSSPFRRLMRRENPGAIGLLVTEFISIEGLTRANRRTVQMLRYHPEELPLSVQIFGYDIARMVTAAQLAEQSGASIVDINCGCPVPKVVRRGGGCELMRHPEHLGKMLKAVAGAIGVPLTLKIRAGWDDSCRNAVEIAKIAEDSGVQMLAVHGRTRVQLYHGVADWDLISEVVDAVKIPVVGSGDVIDESSAQKRLASGVAGLMIGRGALLNPKIFADISAALAGEIKPERNVTDVADILERYANLLSEDLPEKAIIGKLKQLATQAVRSIVGASAVRKALCRAHNTAELLEIVRLWRSCLLGERELPECLREGVPPSETTWREVDGC